jgi:hypothetical protein
LLGPIGGMTDDAQLDYENLDVYRLAIEFFASRCR